MNSAPYLLNEDRRDFERILDEALRSASHRHDLVAAGEPLSSEQLRHMALSATALITAAAASEYQHYVQLRGELRTPARTTRAEHRTGAGPSAGRDRTALGDTSGDSRIGRDGRLGRDSGLRPGDGPQDGGADGDGQGVRARHDDAGSGGGRGTEAVPGSAQRTGASADGETGTGTGKGAGAGAGTGAGATARMRSAAGEPTGAGLAAVVAVLAPLLAGAAAVIFLLVGYVLQAVGPAPRFAHTLLTTGWVFGAITAAAILVAAVGLLLAALRNGATSLRADDRAGLAAEVFRAREAWHQALLERGITPFLQEALVSPDADGAPATRAESTGRIPQLGYHRPGFSSPDQDPTTTPRPRYSSPDYSSPDFGASEVSGPEHLQE